MRRHTILSVGPCVAAIAIALGGCKPSRDAAGNWQGGSTAVRDARSGASSGATSAPETWRIEPPASVALELACADDAEDLGVRIFKRYCAVCHGPEGKGDGTYYVDTLEPKPANLTDPSAAQIWTDAHLTKVVREGSGSVGKSVLCPPWGRVLSDEQVAAVVKFVRRSIGEI